MPPSPSSPASRPNKAREIWLVDKAPVVIEKLKDGQATAWTTSCSRKASTGKPEDVANLKGDDARAAFIKHFKEVQRLQTQLDQYTDLTPEQEQTIETILPKDELNGLPRRSTSKPPSGSRSSRTSPARQAEPAVDAARFRVRPLRLGRHRLRLHHGADRRLLRPSRPGKATMSREQLIGLIAADAKFIDEREDDHRIRHAAQGRRGAGRGGHPRRLPAVQGPRRHAARTGRRSPHKHGLPPERCKASSTPSSTA